MSELKIEEVNGKKKGKLLDVTFGYVKLQEGSYKYQSKTEKEYTVDIVVDKATAKAFKKEFAKNGYKEIETSEFESKYKVAPPLPDADEQFVIKLKADVQLKADVVSANLSKGDDIPYEWATRPKVFVPTDGGVQDVTMEKLVANGSKGQVAFNITSNDFGTFPKLTGILVEDLIEYEGGSGPSSDFGDVVGGYSKGEAQQKASAGQEGSSEDNQGGSSGEEEKQPSAPPQAASDTFDEDEDSIPF